MVDIPKLSKGRIANKYQQSLATITALFLSAHDDTLHSGEQETMEAYQAVTHWGSQKNSLLSVRQGGHGEPHDDTEDHDGGSSLCQQGKCDQFSGKTAEFFAFSLLQEGAIGTRMTYAYYSYLCDITKKLLKKGTHYSQCVCSQSGSSCSNNNNEPVVSLVGSSFSVSSVVSSSSSIGVAGASNNNNNNNNNNKRPLFQSSMHGSSNIEISQTTTSSSSA